MGGVEERVKEFLESCKRMAIAKIVACSSCGAELTDGNFAVIDGKLFCLDCHTRHSTLDTQNHGTK